MWAEILKWAAITLLSPFIVFLLVRFYQELKPVREATWHDQVDQHLRDTSSLIRRFIEVEHRMRSLEVLVERNERLDAAERKEVLDQITHLHTKLDRLMERLLDQLGIGRHS